METNKSFDKQNNSNNDFYLTQPNNNNNYQSGDVTVDTWNKQNSGNQSFLSRAKGEQPKFPQISLTLVDEALHQDLLPADYREKLITNPNKYSIFFTRFDFDSPCIKKAMNNLKVKEEDCKLMLYDQYKRQNQFSNQLELIVNYLKYVTDRYQLLKNLLRERTIIKRQGKSSDDSAIFSSLIGKKQHTKSCSESDFKFSYDEKLEQQKLKFKKLEDVLTNNVNLVKNSEKRIKKFYSIDLQQFNKKIVDAQKKMQKKVNDISVKHRQKYLKAQQRVQQLEEQIQERVEKKYQEFEEKDKLLEEKKKQKLLAMQQNQDLHQQKSKEIKEKISNNQKMINMLNEQNRYQLQQDLEDKEERATQVVMQNRSICKQKGWVYEEKLNDVRSKNYEILHTFDQNEISKQFDKFMSIEQKRQNIQKLQDLKIKAILKKKQTRLQKIDANKEYIQEKIEKKVDELNHSFEESTKRIRKVKSQNDLKISKLIQEKNDRIQKNQVNIALDIMKQNQRAETFFEKMKESQERISQTKAEQKLLLDLNKSLTKEFLTKKKLLYEFKNKITIIE